MKIPLEPLDLSGLITQLEFVPAMAMPSAAEESRVC